MKYNLRTRKIANYNVDKRFNQIFQFDEDPTSKTKVEDSPCSMTFETSPDLYSEIKNLIELVDKTCYPQKVNVLLDCLKTSVLFLKQHPNDKSFFKFERALIKKIVECLVHPEFEHEKKTLQELINQIV